jgi:sulfoxide reductase heme-binding subunit YedZ
MRRRIFWGKLLIVVLALVPLANLLWRGYGSYAGTTPDLGTNPLEAITHSTGDWTLRFLLITLSVTPLRRILGQPWLINFRRMLGLFAFFYGSLHLMTYLWFDKFFDLSEIVDDVAERKFITAGFAAFVLLVPLAITSTKGWIRRLGGKAWQRLHRLIYFSAALGVIHYWWLVKADIREPAIYAAILGVLLGFRIAWKISSMRNAPLSQPAASGLRSRVVAD